MVKLPSNVTVAALALLVGAAFGAGAYHFLAPSPTDEPDWEGRTEIIELDRFLQPRDTTGEAQASRKIRYKTRTDTVRRVDSVFVPIPSYYEEPLVSDAEPLQVTPDRITWTAWNPRKRRHEQRIYRVPDDPFDVQLYALAKAENPPQMGFARPFRVGVGIGGEIRYRSLEARLEATLSRQLRPQVEAGLMWQF